MQRGHGSSTSSARKFLLLAPKGEHIFVLRGKKGKESPFGVSGFMFDRRDNRQDWLIDLEQRGGGKKLTRKGLSNRSSSGEGKRRPLMALLPVKTLRKKKGEGQGLGKAESKGKRKFE